MNINRSDTNILKRSELKKFPFWKRKKKTYSNRSNFCFCACFIESRASFQSGFRSQMINTVQRCQRVQFWISREIELKRFWQPTVYLNFCFFFKKKECQTLNKEKEMINITLKQLPIEDQIDNELQYQNRRLFPCQSMISTHD